LHYNVWVDHDGFAAKTIGSQAEFLQVLKEGKVWWQIRQIVGSNLQMLQVTKITEHLDVAERDLVITKF
jgi:hypothetical protein